MSKLILDLHSLETRLNPAGVYTSTLVGTTLTLTGTDAGESIVIRDDGVGMTILGQNGTTVDGSASKTFTQAVNSVKIVAKGGDDSIDLDSTLPLSLTGRLDIDLGNSTNNNALNLVSPLTISLGSVRVLSGVGQDIVTFGASTATVNGDFIASFGDGPCELLMQPTATIQGNLSMSGGIGFSRLSLDGITVNKNVSFNPGNGTSDLQLSSSVIGGNLRVVGGRGDDAVSLINTTIGGVTGMTVLGGSGKVTVVVNNLDVNFTKGGVLLRSTDNDVTVTSGISFKLAGPTTITGRSVNFLVGADFQTKALTMSGPFGSSFNATNGAISFNGDVRITSTNGAAIFDQSGGSLTALGRMSVSGISSNFVPNGNTTNVSGDVSVLASSQKALFSRSTSSQYNFDGNVTVRGVGADVNFSSGFGGVNKNVTVAALADNLNFNVNGTVTFAKNITISGRIAPANITMISNTASIGGNLSISTGDDSDTVNISGLRVGGTTSIKTAGGGDIITIDNGAKFTGPTLIDSGAGDDLLQFAQAFGLSTTAVEFTGKATIKAGTGNDSLQLGRSNSNSGDIFSLASFGAGSTVDGGLNLNSFDDELGQTAGSPTILNWTDPTP